MRPITNGMWVRTDAGVGIFTLHRFAQAADGTRRPLHNGELQEGETVVDEPWVHLTNDDGTTLAQIPAVRAGNVVQAAKADIPAARIPGLSDEQLAKLGYV